MVVIYGSMGSVWCIISTVSGSSSTPQQSWFGFCFDPVNTRVNSGQQTVIEVNSGQTVKLVNSGQQVSPDSITVQLVSVMVQDWFEWVNWFRFGFRVNTSTGQTLVNDSQLSGQRRSTQDPVKF